MIQKLFMGIITIFFLVRCGMCLALYNWVDFVLFGILGCSTLACAIVGDDSDD